MNRLLPLLPVLGLALAACSDSGAAPAGPPKAAERDADAFPLAGRWIWAAGARGLPSRDIGCSDGGFHLAARPSALDVERGTWRNTILLVVGWRREDPAGLRLHVLDSSAEGRRRLTLRLDLATPGFVHLAGVVDERGRPSSAEPWAGMFPMIRCPDPAADVTVALRGPVGAPAEWSLR
jgi:hypothetical protein